MELEPAELYSSEDPPDVLPRYLKVLHALRVVLCVEHGACYTRANVDRHLARSHNIKAHRRREILAFLKSTGKIASCLDDVSKPVNGGSPISGLPIHNGYRCEAADCNFLTINADSIKQHCFKSHGWKRKFDKTIPYQAVSLQTLWTKTQQVDYFIIIPPANQGSSSTNYTAGGSNSSKKTPLLSAKEAKSGWDALQTRFRQAQEKRVERYSHVQIPAHISEITPWLKSTGYHIHIAEVDVEELPRAYKFPDAQDEPLLATVCDSVERVLRKVMAIMEDDVMCEHQRLNRLNAKLLNTFRRAEMSKDPIKPLQNKRSAATYIQTWQKLVCYFYRVKDGGCLRENLFRPTERQLKYAAAVMEAANDVKLRGEEEEEDEEDEGQEDEGGTKDVVDKLDNLVLELSLALIQQRLDMRAFDSAVISFAAVLAWDANPRVRGWMNIGYYTSYLSQLIYDSQLIVLQHCLDALDARKTEDLSGYLVSVRDQWLLNDTPGPIGELLATRLLGSKIAQNTVGQAHVRWHQDGQTVTYKDVKFTMADLRDLIEQELAAARKIFYRDICFGLKNVPCYDIHKLSDNWDASHPGDSFLTDSRNKEHLAGGDTWLLDNLRLHPHLFGLLVSKTAGGEWQVSSDAAYQYEGAVQRFLEHMMICVHIGSGQPARKPEFLGTRWCNKQADKRNLFIHDGYLLFILTYHKSLNLTNASRWPVRFLLPQVGELMVQYLVLILPFRIWLKEEVLIPEDVSEYLWSKGRDTWSEDKMTSILASETKATISTAINVQKWRQIAIGIGIKKFAGLDYQLDLDLAGDEDDEDEGPSGGGYAMPEVFHWQASHGPRTGNGAYGGTVNFRNGLTDAGLQEYLRASQMWHGLCRDPVQKALKGTERDRSPSKHLRVESKPDASDAPLAKRIAYRKAPLRHRRRWTKEEAWAALKDLHGPRAQYKSAKQEEAMQDLLDGTGQVVVVLSTGEGKSLLYMLPSILPSAGTTVVMLPLIGLKHDMMRRLDRMGLGYKVWECKEDETLGCPLVFVSVDKAVTSSFRSYLNRLEAGNALDRVVFDESHLAITASQYRPKMNLVKYLRSLRCQFVYLTATLPPNMVTRFEQAMLLCQPRIIRSLTLRTDLEYWVRRSSIANLQAFALAEITAVLREPWFIEEKEARCIVYTTTRTEADELAESLQCLVYYSDSGTDEEKASALTKWVAGESRVMVATSAFGPGISHPHVRAVFHVGHPESAIDFAQEAGRAGRDGKGGLSCIFLPKTWKPVDAGPAGELLPDEMKAMQRYLDDPRCRMLPLGRFLDGVAQACKNEGMSCDRCHELGLLAGIDEIELAAAGEPGEQSGGLLEEADESESSSSAEDLEVGSQLLKQHVRDQERCLQRYIANLELLKGSCLLCRLVDSPDPTTSETVRGADHTLEKCRAAAKWRFFDSKRAAMEEGRRRFSDGQGRRKGWLSAYTACFKCGNPQAICPMQGKHICEYRDILTPACWGAYQRVIWREQILKELAGREFRNELEYMLWLGEEREVYGQRACNMMFIADQVMMDILSGLLSAS